MCPRTEKINEIESTRKDYMCWLWLSCFKLSKQVCMYLRNESSVGAGRKEGGKKEKQKEKKGLSLGEWRGEGHSGS